MRSRCGLVDLLLFVDRELSRAHVDQQKETATRLKLARATTHSREWHLHNRENLEEVVFGEVLVRVVGVQRPEVVDHDVEHAKDNDKHDGAPLGLESDNHHDASNKSKQANSDPPEAPVATENEANEQENEEDTTRELEVHPLVLLIELGKTGGGELLAHPGIRQDHQKSTHNRQVAEEEIEVEDESVANSLKNDDTDEAEDTVVGVFAGNDLNRADGHGDYVENEE